MPIRLLTFDLDDTLWDFLPVLVRAEEITYSWLQKRIPALTAQFSNTDLRDMRLQVARENPQLAHRVSELRTRGLHLAMQRAGITEPNIEALIAEAFEVFLCARHDIELFDDADRVLSELKNYYQLAAITNGNFDTARAGLDRYFKYSINAEQLVRAKPHPEPFLKALELAACAPEQCIHIGDDAENDVRGAQRVGMHTIWVNWKGLPWEGELRPTAEVRQLAELPTAIHTIATSLK